MYPLQQETSYIPFRERNVNAGRNYARTRLDFFLVSKDVVNDVKHVIYEERLGADFDHKEVTLKIGKTRANGKMNVFDTTLDDSLAEYMGFLSVYEAIATHLEVRDDALDRNIGRLDMSIREKELIGIVVIRTGGNDFTQNRLDVVNNVLDNVIRELPDISLLLERGITCSYRSLYEVALINLKNRLIARQTARLKECELTRSDIMSRCENMRDKFGDNSVQYMDEHDKLLRYDDLRLKERAVKFREFLDANNEKASKAFCKLSKEGGLCDDTSQICNANGENFKHAHIKDFYENLYKKRLDNLFEIEDFLMNEDGLPEWINDRKLSNIERDTLEEEVTMEELTKSMEASNFDSAGGWDGISFKVLRKYWGVIGPLMLKMVNEIFRAGELPETFKLGLIKVIPKKGNAKKVEDWRPITLLCCGYKIISGVVAVRLEKFLMKIIGRAQKGFHKSKNIHTCTINIMNSISHAWASNEGTGIMCVDFSKAFDSIEHLAIDACLRFFNFGIYMRGMVKTILKDRKARIILNDGYSETFGIKRGTPQGDRSSPFIFIICIEVLLIKIVDMQGRGVDLL
jgi:hypothetical protein